MLVILVDTLDCTSAAAFREQAAPLVKASTGPLVVDCSKLVFVDSSGVGALLHVRNLLPADRLPVRLTGVGKKVLTILELMRVHRSFDLDPGS